jgi:uncharacterized protein YidB (DUF937 family)
MGMLDNVMQEVAPGGDITKPAMIALGALLVGKMVEGGAGQAASSQPGSPPADPGIAGGLGGLIGKLQAAGLGDVVKSWVGSGQNAPITPGQLGSALGPQTVTNLAEHTGINEQELLAQLAQALPVIVDKLTANGQVPSQRDLAA